MKIDESLRAIKEIAQLEDTRRKECKTTGLSYEIKGLRVVIRNDKLPYTHLYNEIEKSDKFAMLLEERDIKPYGKITIEALETAGEVEIKIESCTEVKSEIFRNNVLLRSGINAPNMKVLAQPWNVFINMYPFVFAMLKENTNCKTTDNIKEISDSIFMKIVKYNQKKYIEQVILDINEIYANTDNAKNIFNHFYPKLLMVPDIIYLDFLPRIFPLYLLDAF